MAPRRRANCQICEETESKYTCSKCHILYCSVSCYKHHKDSSCIEQASGPVDTASNPPHSRLPLEVDGTRSQYEITSYAPTLAATETRQTAQDDLSAGPLEVGHIPALSESVPNSYENAAPQARAQVNSALITNAPPEKTRSPGMTARAEHDDDAGQQRASGLRSHAANVCQASSSLGSAGTSKTPDSDLPEGNDAEVAEQRPLRKLTSLKWPYVPEEPSYPDPLKRDDPKPLNLRQYEAIATSAAVRRALSAHPRLPTLLAELDQLRGSEREDELERVLGVSQAQSTGFSIAGLPSTSTADYAHASSGSSFSRAAPRPRIDIDGEDMKALRALAEAVESAVRGERPDVLGLDWEAMAG